MANNLTFTDGNMTLKNITEYPNSFKRQGAFPLERFSVFNTKAALEAYAKSNPVAYVGQILALVTEVNDSTEVTVYSIQDAEGTLAEVGKATAGDEKSIHLNANSGILSLNDFGERYYKYNADTKAYSDEPTEGWKDGLVPVVHVDKDGEYKLIWKEPNPTTVEGLQDRIDKILPIIPPKDEVVYTTNVNQTIDGIKTFKNSPIVPTPTTDVAAANKKYVDDTVAELGTVFTLVATMSEEEFQALAGKVPETWANGNTSKAGDVVLVKIKDLTGTVTKDTEIEYVVVDDGTDKRFEKFGDPSGVSSAVSRITKVESDLTAIKPIVDEHTETLDDHENRITALEESTESMNGIISGKLDDVKSTDAQMTAEKSGTIVNLTINKVNEAKNADNADKVTNKLTFKETPTSETNIFEYDGSEDITFSKSEHIASDDKLGFIKSSSTADLDGIKVDSNTGKATVGKVSLAKTAGNVEHKLTIFGKDYDGSQDVVIDATDNIGVATDTKLGLVKSTTITTGLLDVVEVTQTGDDKGKMKVSKVTAAVNADNATKANEADKVTNALKFGDKSYNGSKAEEITLSDLGFKAGDYATAAQGTKADSALQKEDVTIATGTTNGTISVKIGSDATAADVKVKGLGTAAYKDEEYFATATSVSTLDGSAVKTSGNQSIDGEKIFTGKVIVPTPTADTDAATKKYVDDEISSSIAAVDSMTFKGLLGGEGNIAALPTEDVRNGDTYKVAVAGTYDSVAAKAGDMFIALVTKDEAVSIKWQYIPSADDGNVMADATLAADQLVIGNGNKDIKSLAAGTNGNVLKMVDGKPAWSKESITEIISSDGSIEVTKEDTTYDLKVAKVNLNKLEQTEGDYLIFDCGSSTKNI